MAAGIAAWNLVNASIQKCLSLNASQKPYKFTLILVMFNPSVTTGR